MKKTIAATKKFRKFIEKTYKKNGFIETKVAKIDDRRDIKDIFTVCDLIIQGADEDDIEKAYGRLDTVIKDAFPLDLFNQYSELVVR